MNYQFWVYIVGSTSGTLYTGVTNNLLERVRQHRSGEVHSFSQKYGCYKLLYYEEHQYILNAIAREKQIKRWRRSKKEFLIRMKNHRWDDLSLKWLE